MQLDASSSLCFDDILLVPKHSKVYSRGHVDLSMKIDSSGTKLDLPVIASPMDTVCESAMAIAMYKAGGVGIIHRYMSIKEQSAELLKVNAAGALAGVAVGVQTTMHEVNNLLGHGACLILLDTANGHSEIAIESARKIGQNFPDVHLMAGNVATIKGFHDMASAGVDSIRVGIGGGSVCSTRLVSGHGVPTLGSIIECAKLKFPGYTPAIIADGGIRTTGDMVKAFAAGADAVMLGSVLAGHDESPGECIGSHKVYRGMASENAQQRWGCGSKRVEGVSAMVKYRGPVSSTLDNIRQGLQSGCSYTGVHRLVDLSAAAKYIQVSASTLAESRPREFT